MDLILTFFFLLTIILFLKYKLKFTFYHYLLSLVSLIFALMSKEMAVTLPVIILLHQKFFNNKSDKENEIRNLKHILIIIKIFFLITVLLFILGIIVNPEFVAKYFSSDGILKLQSIQKIKNFQYVTLWGSGIIIFLLSPIFFILNRSLRISNTLRSYLYIIPYCIIVAFYLIARSVILGGFGGAYTTSSGNSFLSFGLDTFLRDIFGLVGLIWPVGNNYNVAIFKLQFQNPFIFYFISTTIWAAIFFIGYKLFSHTSKSFGFSFFLDFYHITTCT